MSKPTLLMVAGFCSLCEDTPPPSDLVLCITAAAACVTEVCSVAPPTMLVVLGCFRETVCMSMCMC